MLLRVTVAILTGLCVYAYSIYAYSAYRRTGFSKTLRFRAQEEIANCKPTGHAHQNHVRSSTN